MDAPNASKRMKLEPSQEVIVPKNPLPIVIIGAGGIIKDAHVPAYTKAGMGILGVYDRDPQKSAALQKEFNAITQVYATLSDLIADAKKHGAVYDLAVPAHAIIPILEQIPDGSAILIQKPMGDTLEDARRILALCEKKKLISAVNFQLRYAPYMVAARELIDKGLLGEVYDMELMVCVHTPWDLWDFLFDLPRMEILYHSIHYLDLMRSFLGSPTKIYASTIKHPKMLNLASTRTSMILDYPNHVQARVITNHGHAYGLEKQESYFKIEGTKGAIKIRIGLSLDYPNGLPPKFEYALLGDEVIKWKEIPLKGGWFPDAFIGTMAGLQRHVLTKNIPLPHSTKDAFETMKLVEAAYISSESGGVQLASIN